MKKVWFILLPLAVIMVSFASCGDDDESLIDLPPAIENYLNTNYSDYEIEESEQETDCEGTAVYDVELEGSNDVEIELTFDTEGNFLYSESEIETNELPAAVASSISANYSGYSIEEAEKLEMFDDSLRYEVELKDNSGTLEVIFEADGTVVCEQEDDDE